jgi:hypothetical protein
MAGPRLTAPAAKLVRSIATASSTGAIYQASTIATSSKASVPLMRKYADLLKERNLDGDVRTRTTPARTGHAMDVSPDWDGQAVSWSIDRSLTRALQRHIYTRSANRPHPPPQKMRLMQTFSSSAPRPMMLQAQEMDHTILPSFESLAGPRPDYTSRLRVPILPDNFVAHHTPEVVDEPLPLPEINVVAADPDKVYIAALTEVEGMTVDGVELKFAHGGAKQGLEQGVFNLGRMTF